MQANLKESSSTRILVAMAALVVIFAGFSAAKVIVVPFLLALFISIAASAPLSWLQRKGVPLGLALLIVIACILIFGVAWMTLIAASVKDFSSNIPTYEYQFKEQVVAVTQLLTNWGVDMGGLQMTDVVKAGSVMKFITVLFNGLGNVLTNGFLILMTVTFMLLESSSFPRKLNSISSSSSESLQRFDQFVKDIRHYMAIKTLISMITGTVAATLVWLLGIDYPILWGLLAFMLNYVPNVGSIVAACPPAVLAVVQYGFARAILVVLVYLFLNILMGNIVEPRWMGRGLGISVLVVFLSLLFWGWLLGPVGMLLSVPLTVTVKMALDSHDHTRWASKMLGSVKS